MATLRRVVPSGQISNFRAAPPEAGGGFRLLAEGLDAVYKRLEPVAMAEEAAKGEADFRGLAKQQISGDAIYGSTSGGGYRDAIASIESGGRYDAVGPTDPKLGRALGKYQVMEANVGPWSEEVLGRKVSAEEFLASPEIQDAIFDGKFGQYVARFGEEGAAQAWFAGPGGVGKTDRKDVLGTDVGSYGQKFMSALSSSSGSTPDSEASFVPTMLRQADGKLVTKLYDPSAGPILQAYNIAAGAAYQSEIFLKGQVDMMGLREQFALDPEGFKQAADAYLDGIVGEAPDLFKSDIRAGLQNELQQTFLGILDDKHRDIQQRASNSNQAIIDKWSDSLASAIAGGDPKQIGGARSQLGAALALREKLPGLAWTPAQSENAIREAEEDGQRRIQKQRDEQKSTLKSTLKTITEAAKKNMTAAAEDILDNPMVQALLPDEWREAMAFTTLRDQMPSFMKASPAEQRAFIAEMKKQPVTEGFEPELRDAMDKAAADNEKALLEDPIPRLAEIFPEDPPPQLVMPTEDPQGFVDSLAARAEYATRKAAEGFTKKPIFVSKEEAKALGAMFGKDVPADMKSMALTQIVQAMGPDAAGLFDQIGITDTTVRSAGMALASGVDPSAANDALIGRQRLDEGMVQTPEEKAVMGGFSDDMRQAIEAVPGASGMFNEMKDFAISIYAATVPPNATPSQQKDAMAAAWGRALGGSKRLDGADLGGVQKIGGNPVWMSPGLNGDEVTQAFDAAFGKDVPIWVWASDQPGDMSVLSDAANGAVPLIDGKPITPDQWSNGNITMTPEQGGLYRLQVVYPDGSRSDVRTDTRAPFIFDAEALVQNWRGKTE